MFMHVQRLINDIVPDEPDPAAANALQEGLGGQFGEMRTMMQYLFQSFNFRGATGKPYRDLLYGIGTEEIAHVELIATTISRLLDGSPQYKGKATKPLDEPGKGGATPLSVALDHSNIHHYLVGAQGALPVDAAGNPWSGSYVYAKALETLGINWGKTLPIPKTNAERFPEVKKLLDQGLHLKQFTFSADNLSEAGKVFRGAAPASMDGGELSTETAPEGFPMDIAVERPEEFGPGLDPELMALVQATAELELKDADDPVAAGRKK